MPENKIRQCGLPGFELGDYIKEAIDFIRDHESKDGYHVCFSGGKDSITSLELCRMAGVKHKAYYSCTRIDPPEIYKFIKLNYPDVIWLYSKKSFWRMCLENMPPRIMQRWCCDKLKKIPAVNIGSNNRIVGIRSEESPRRATRPRVDIQTKHKGQILYKPIFH